MTPNSIQGIKKRFESIIEFSRETKSVYKILTHLKRTMKIPYVRRKIQKRMESSILDDSFLMDVIFHSVEKVVA